MVGVKTSLKYFVVDAFTSSPLKGNPAVVLLLDEEKDQECLQAMAQEFNLLTCFVTKVTTLKASKTPRYNLRWFAPASEVKICGHGTIACTHAIFSTGVVQGNEIEFDTLSGVFLAKRIIENNRSGSHEISKNDEIFQNGHKKFLIQLRFPLYPTVQLESNEMKLVPPSLKGPSTLNIMKMSRENDLIVELMSSKDVTDYKPKMDEIKKWPGRGVAITGLAPPESEFDFFTRLFSPNFGIDEDQVCGSIHCAVAPYWSKKLGKSHLKAYMASPRGGILRLNVDTDAQSVLIAGEAVTVMEGSFVA
ncbi:uncharacterized protein LOC110684958 [Chenopodium quinoa]|uniref:uncharacterized protein LOC110684958 n=1 Tax=Chenopodium quinoa TaxID=63459 RepID=UPI000B7759B0|nr:uncharacterized protein LOC110684958 [Chenopodium quinoa]XP_021717097.1 uncharacterized protein LOC110684958 [Chenopodium quinoa]